MKYVAAIILAAGESSRMGQPKQLLAYGQGSLIQRIAATALQAEVCKVIVILGAHGHLIEGDLHNMPVQILDNKEWKEGIASSIRRAINWLQENEHAMDAVLLLVSDQPFVSADLLNRLMAEHIRSHKPIIASSYANTLGTPVLFSKALFNELKALVGQEGAKKVLHRHRDQVLPIPFPLGEIDIDTPEDFKNLFDRNDSLMIKKGYSAVNGLKMYYEVYGEGSPLVLLHGGGSTIETGFGRLIPLLSTKRQIIAVELQAHGRTSDRDADLTFEQDAADVVKLLGNLEISKADFLGFSNGGTTTLQIAIRHPEIVNKMILGSPLAKRSGVPESFWGFMENASLDNMPEQLKEAYLQVAPDPKGLQVMHDRDARRMVNFRDIPDEQIAGIKLPTLIIIGDKDVIKPEHALELHRMIAGSELAIIPGVHGEYIGEITTLGNGARQENFVAPLIENFLGN